MSKLILGVATNSRGKYKSRVDGKMTKPYGTWRNMLLRAYYPKYHAINPTYIGCSVSGEWLEYQTFAEWFDSHDYSNRGYHLDKDLLIPGNKIYAPSTVCFIPTQLNSLLNDQANSRGKFLQEVCLNRRDNNFLAQINIDGKQKHLGYFETEIEAYHVYKKAKESNVKRTANHWQDDIAANVYDALMTWELGQ